MRKNAKKISKTSSKKIVKKSAPVTKRAYKRKTLAVPTPSDDIVNAVADYAGIPTPDEKQNPEQRDQMQFNGVDPTELREYNSNEARWRVRQAAVAMSDAARAVAINNNGDDRFVLAAQAQLAGAEFDRALLAFEKLLRI